MLCYETEFTYRLKNGGNIESDEEKDAFEKKVRSVNKQLQAKWGENSYSIIVKADAKSFCAVTVTNASCANDTAGMLMRGKCTI